MPARPHADVIAAIYALSLVLVVVAWLCAALLSPTLGSQALYLFLVPPVFIAAVLGGIGPALLTTAFGLVLHLYLTGRARASPA